MYAPSILRQEGLRDLLIADLAVEWDLVGSREAAHIVLSSMTRARDQPSLVTQQLATVGDLRAGQVLQLCLEADQQIHEARDSAGAAIADRGGLDSALHRTIVCEKLDAFGTGVRNTMRPMPADRYVNFRLRAVGGRGLVYFARDRDIGRAVAIKMLRPAGHEDDIDDPLLLAPPRHGDDLDRYQLDAEAFCLEARRTARMRHSGIPSVFETGRTPKGIPYFVMPAGSGLTLRDAMAEERLPGSARVGVLLKVAEAVHHAHDRHGLVHCDLNPGNIMLGESGEVLVLDWGEARRTGNWSSQQGISAAGTDGWIAPELRRDPCRIAATIDVFALGLMIYEILTGSRPNPGQRLRLPEAPHDVGRLAPAYGIPAANQRLSDLCMNCLATAPAYRPRNVGVVAQEIRDALAGRRNNRERK